MRNEIPNIEWLGVREDDGAYGSKTATRNAQRSTPNSQLRKTGHFDLEDRLLDFSACIIRLVDAPEPHAFCNPRQPLRRAPRCPLLPHPSLAQSSSVLERRL